MKNEVIKYDGPLDIAVGASRTSVNWKNQSLPWGALVERLKTATRTPETMAEYKAMPKSRRDQIKDIGGFVGGSLKGPRRKADAVASRQLLTLDLDSLTAKDKPWDTVKLVLGCAAAVYGTHSYTEAAPRLRILMPLARPVTPDEYGALSRRIAADIGIDLMDDTTYEPSRLMYWPSVSLDASYFFDFIDGPWIDPDEQLARYNDWRDPAEWPVSSRKTSVMQRLAKKQEDPTTKPGVVGAFCRTYDIPGAIETFLPETYTPYQDDRYTFTGGSTVGGLVLYENGKFAYSHHGTDPAGGQLCNAFDLVRLHAFGEKDYDAPAGIPAGKLPSFTAMAELALTDDAVRAELARTRLEETRSLWDDDEAGDDAGDLEWLKTLEINKKGNFADTTDNVKIIMLNDIRLKDKFFFDEFRERPTVKGSLPWIGFKERTSPLWNDADDAGLRWYLEKFYGLERSNKISDAVELAMLTVREHPVRAYLEGLVWDGTERADSVFIDYLGADDTVYVREVTRRALIGAVARIFRPGCKHDHMLVLVGPQGCRKSTTIARLAKGYFSDSLYTLTGKDAFEQLQGYWLIEFGEMAPTKRAELEQVKQFISKTSDSYRAAYARRTQEHPRQCAFFGTTNDATFLRDPTGGRRFWPVDVTEAGAELGDRLTDDVVDQIWAETVERFKAGEAWHLSGKMEQEARKEQERHAEVSSKRGQIETFLASPVPANWDNFTLEQRRAFYDYDADGGEILRQKICAIEVWVELFKGDYKSFTPVQAREINDILRGLPGWVQTTKIKTKCYGNQRGFIRDILV